MLTDCSSPHGKSYYQSKSNGSSFKASNGQTALGPHGNLERKKNDSRSSPFGSKGVSSKLIQKYTAQKYPFQNCQRIKS